MPASIHVFTGFTNLLDVTANGLPRSCTACGMAHRELLYSGAAAFTAIHIFMNKQRANVFLGARKGTMARKSKRKQVSRMREGHQ